MKKQELIETLEYLECGTFNANYNAGYDQGVYDSLGYVRQLDEFKKVVISETADDFIEKGLEQGDDKVDIIASAISFSEAKPQDAFSVWFKSNGDLFVDVISNGYEVEKGPLYHVLLLDKGATKTGYTFLNSKGEIDFTISKEKLDVLTELEIKAIDERYWIFAMKVKEE